MKVRIICCVCKKVIRVEEWPGEVEAKGDSHGYCDPCYKIAMAEAQKYLNESKRI